MSDLWNNQVPIVEGDGLDLNKTVVLAKFRDWMVLDELHVLEAWLVGIAGFDNPSGCGLWQRHACWNGRREEGVFPKSEQYDGKETKVRHSGERRYADP